MSELPQLERKLHTCQVVLWLKRTFEHTGGGGGEGEDGADGEADAQAESMMISKEELYRCYLAMCHESQARPLFSRPVVGKMVKRAFPTIQTRRRGPRTNVKQHWIGLRQVDDTSADSAAGRDFFEPQLQPRPQRDVQSSPSSPHSSLSTSSSATPGGSPVTTSSTTTTTTALAQQPSPVRAPPVIAKTEAIDQRHPISSSPTRNAHSSSSVSPHQWAYDHNQPQPQQRYPGAGSQQHAGDNHNYHQLRWQQEQGSVGGPVHRGMASERHQPYQQQHHQQYLLQHYARPPQPQPQSQLQMQFQTQPHSNSQPYPPLHNHQLEHQQAQRHHQHQLYQHQHQLQHQFQQQQQFDRLPYYEFPIEEPPLVDEATLDDLLLHLQPASSSSSSHPYPYTQEQGPPVPLQQHQHQFAHKHQLRPPPQVDGAPWHGGPTTTTSAAKLERDGIVAGGGDGDGRKTDSYAQWPS